jgi:hypothetical protein
MPSLSDAVFTYLFTYIHNLYYAIATAGVSLASYHPESAERRLRPPSFSLFFAFSFSPYGVLFVVADAVLAIKEHSAGVRVENITGQRVYGRNFAFHSAVCVSLVRFRIGPLSLCLLYAFAVIPTEQSISQSPTSLPPAHVRTLFVQQCQQAMRITGIYTPAHASHLLYYGFQFIAICTTYLCCMEMRVCKLPSGQIEAVYGKTMCSFFLHGIVRIDIDHVMPILMNVPVFPSPARFQHV